MDFQAEALRDGGYGVFATGDNVLVVTRKGEVSIINPDNVRFIE